MAFRYPKSMHFSGTSRQSSSGITSATYRLGKMGPGFGSISRIYNFCHNNTGDYNSAIQCVFGIQPTTPPTPTPFETTFYFSDEPFETTTEDTVLTRESYNHTTRRINLVSVIIGTTCLSIDFGCFSDCFNLTSVTIPNSVISLGEECFYACTKLTSVTIPNSVTSIGEVCFGACLTLSSVKFNDPGNITTNMVGILADIVEQPIAITFYNTLNWGALNEYVNPYFTDPPPPESNWTYFFEAGPP